MAKRVLDDVRSIVNTGENLVLIHPDAAVLLFLKGVIKPEQLALAKENQYFIEIQVNLNKAVVTVRIINGFTYFVSSGDEMIVF